MTIRSYKGEKTLKKLYYNSIKSGKVEQGTIRLDKGEKALDKFALMRTLPKLIHPDAQPAQNYSP